MAVEVVTAAVATAAVATATAVEGMAVVVTERKSRETALFAA